VIDETWAADCLAVSGTQAYSVSEFRPSPLYGGRPTCIFAAGIRGAGGRSGGGIAVVFDTAPQLAAMLQDSIPKDDSGKPRADCVAVFLDRDLRVLACTNPALDVARLEWVRESARAGEAQVMRIGDEYYSVGAKRDTGYREYEGLGGYAVVLMPLGRVSEQTASRRLQTQRPAARQEGARQELVELATFAVGENWYALPTDHVIEAVDARSLQSLPKTQSWCAGYLMFGGEPIVVADMARLLGATNIEAPRVAIVIRPPDQTRPFGLLVEALGDIPEVARDRLLTIDNLRTGDMSLLVEFALQVADPGDPMVMVLNTQRLAKLLRGEPLEVAAA
jgi:chemotaxis signal transduction protein